MNKQSMTSFKRGAQSGFTLIELVVVIVILGVLAATALPKFADMGGDARFAKLKAAQGSITSAAAIYHGAWVARGSLAATTSLNGVTGNATGYPVSATGGVDVAAGIASTDYTLVSTATTATFTVDATHAAACFVTYTEATGVVAVTGSATVC